MKGIHGRPIAPEDLMAIKSVADVQLSPDGRHVAYALTEISVEKDSYRSTIWIAPAGGGAPLQVTRGPGRDSAPRWSPDGLSLSFLSDRGGGPPQMFLLPMGGGEPRHPGS
jgi:dipeptidyl aminopeptidase/acylaminoacyl peptidase